MTLRSTRYFTLAPLLTLGLLLSPKTSGLLFSLLLVGVLITLHELGHFLVARWMKVPVDVFSIGFGPRLLGFAWGETDVRLSAVPLGGYVKVAGDPEENDGQDPSFFRQPYSKRTLFYGGGILANVVTAFVLFAVLQTDQQRTVAFLEKPLSVREVVEGLPAQQAGLKAGDQIHAMGELKFPGMLPVAPVAYIQARPGQPIPFDVERQGQRLQILVTPRREGGNGKIGLLFGEYQYRFEQRAFRFADLGPGIAEAGRTTTRMGWDVLKAYGRLFAGRSSVKEVGGPVSIVRAGSDAAQAGWRAFLFFAALISMNLAVLNALPIPGLDGSHIVLLGIEKVRGRDLSLQLKERILTVGVYFLLGVMTFVIGLDVWRMRH
jgi:regulator of sigma E protease